LHTHIKGLAETVLTANNSLFTHVIALDEVQPRLDAAGIDSFIFDDSLPNPGKVIAARGCILSHLDMNDATSIAFFLHVFKSVFVMLGKRNTQNPISAMRYIYVGGSQVVALDRARASYNSKEETRNHYSPRAFIMLAGMLQERVNPHKKSCVEALVNHLPI